METIDERIESKKREILGLIDQMKRENKRDKVTDVCRLQKEYWTLEMERDISDVPLEKRDEFLRIYGRIYSFRD